MLPEGHTDSLLWWRAAATRYCSWHASCRCYTTAQRWWRRPSRSSRFVDLRQVAENASPWSRRHAESRLATGADSRPGRPTAWLCPDVDLSTSPSLTSRRSASHTRRPPTLRGRRLLGRGSTLSDSSFDNTPWSCNEVDSVSSLRTQYPSSGRRPRCRSYSGRRPRCRSCWSSRISFISFMLAGMKQRWRPAASTLTGICRTQRVKSIDFLVTILTATGRRDPSSSASALRPR